MNNQDVNENTSSGRKMKEEWVGTGHPQPKETEDKRKDGLDNSRGMGVRGLGGYNTAQQGSEPIASITEDVEEGKKVKYINPKNLNTNNNMADKDNIEAKDIEDKSIDEEVEEKSKTEHVEEEDSKDKSVDAIKTSIDSLVEQIKSLATGQTGVSDAVKSIDSRLKALEKPTDLPLKPQGSGGEDVGAAVKVPEKPYPQGDQSGLDSDRSGEDKPVTDNGKLRASEKSQLVEKSSHNFTTETPRPGSALETVEKSSQDFSPILKDARTQGYEGLSKVAQDILAGKYYKPSDEEVRGF